MASGKVKVAGLLVGAMLLAVGCQRALLNGFLDPSQVGRFDKPGELQSIRQVVSIKDEPLDIEAARDPAPRDLEAIYQDYLIGPGDTINVLIYDLVGRGTESTFPRQVSETGSITLPELGLVKVGGLTYAQVEQRVAELLQQGGIIARNPQVTVTILERRHQNFEMLGGFFQPGSYQIPRPDFRLLDAIGLARDIQPGIETIYVVRSHAMPEEAAPATQAAAAEVPAIVPAAATVPSEAELQEILPGPTTAAATQEADGPRRLILVGDQWVEVPATATTAAEPTATPAAPTAPAGPDWIEAITEVGQHKILRIPVRELLRGDPRYNVVVRPDDKVYAWIGPVGEFYVMGQVYRPGVFVLTGRRLTVRMAIAAAGGLAPLAWPNRCELVRRYTDNQEEIIQLDLDAIFAGTQPDVALKPNDVLNIGSHPVAPFLATFRNAFRMTYGFGFVYDRNFADIDSYSARANPADVRRADRAQLFGSLFR